MGGHRGGHRVRRGPRGPPDRADGLVDGRRHRAAHLRALGPPRPDPQSDPGLAGGRLAGHPDLPRHRAAGTASHAPAGPVGADLPARREDGAPAVTAGAAREETRGPRRPPGPPDPSRRLAALRPDLVEFVPVEGASHTREWNRDPARWERAVAEHLIRVLELPVDPRSLQLPVRDPAAPALEGSVGLRL